MFAPCAAMFEIAIPCLFVQGCLMQLESDFMYLAENVNNFKEEIITKH